MANENRMPIDENALNQVAAGWSRTEGKTVSGLLTTVILDFLSMLNPSYGYSDVEANFQSLVYEWVDYYLGVDGKTLSDMKCKCIEIAVTQHGIPIDQLKARLDEVLGKN